MINKWKYELAHLGWVNQETGEVSITNPVDKVTLDGSDAVERARRQFVHDNQEQVLKYAQLGHEYKEGYIKI